MTGVQTCALPISGKGGVGKSTMTANLAAALTVEGKRVGVLDADVWGYSIPRMYGLGATRPDVSAQRKIIPLESHGVRSPFIQMNSVFVNGGMASPGPDNFRDPKSMPRGPVQQQDAPLAGLR